MKKGLSVVLILAILFCMSAGCGQKMPLEITGENSVANVVTAEEGQAIVRVLQYNAQNCDDGKKIQEVAEEIRSVNPQIVCLQELDWDTKRSGRQEVLKQLAELLSMNYLFVPAISFQGGLYGIGILSVYPLENNERFILPVQNGEEGRILAKAQVRINETTVDILNTHLSFESAESRQKQFSLLQEHLKNVNHFILCGDFNVEGYSEFDTLENVCAVNTAETNYLTYLPDEDETDMFLGLDNIIVSGNMKIQSSQMINTTVSDHNMLVADIIL